MKERIIEIRKLLGLTQQQFADRLGIKRGTVANYEVGRNMPSKSIRRIICEEFCVNRLWLEKGEGPIFAPERQHEVVEQIADQYFPNETDSLRSKLISAICELSEDQLKVLAFIAERIINQ